MMPEPDHEKTFCFVALEQDFQVSCYCCKGCNLLPSSKCEGFEPRLRRLQLRAAAAAAAPLSFLLGDAPKAVKKRGGGEQGREL